MRIAILGTRGIPARYGGFETFAEELSARLADAGHDVTVYTRNHLAVPGIASHRGARVRVLPALRTKAFETLSHTLLSCLDVRRSDTDVVLLCNAANAPLIPLLHARGLKVALNVDGLERKRRKWGAVGRAYYLLCERLSARWADAVVTDADVIARYYRRTWRRDSTMIPYGGDLPHPTTPDARCAACRSRPDAYLLYVSRFEPENNPDRVVAAYRDVPGDTPLVLVGSAPYAAALGRRVRALAANDRRVLLAGPVYGEGYRELLFNARAYIHATEVGGTHPALVEAMGAGRVVFFLDNPPNREVVRDSRCGVQLRRYPFAATGAVRLPRLAGAVRATRGRGEGPGGRGVPLGRRGVRLRASLGGAVLRESSRLIAYRRLLLDELITAASFLAAHQLRSHVLPVVLPSVFPSGLYPLADYLPLLPVVLVVWGVHPGGHAPGHPRRGVRPPEGDRQGPAGGLPRRALAGGGRLPSAHAVRLPAVPRPVRRHQRVRPRRGTHRRAPHELGAPAPRGAGARRRHRRLQRRCGTDCRADPGPSRLGLLGSRAGGRGRLRRHAGRRLPGGGVDRGAARAPHPRGRGRGRPRGAPAPTRRPGGRHPALPGAGRTGSRRAPPVPAHPAAPRGRVARRRADGHVRHHTDQHPGVVRQADPRRHGGSHRSPPRAAGLAGRRRGHQAVLGRSGVLPPAALRAARPPLRVGQAPHHGRGGRSAARTRSRT